MEQFHFTSDCFFECFSLHTKHLKAFQLLFDALYFGIKSNDFKRCKIIEDVIRKENSFGYIELEVDFDFFFFTEK